jgi:predicted CopG family antitoxin
VGKVMPVPGYKNITVTEEVYGKLEILAKEDNRSVSNEAEHLIIKADKNRKRSQKAVEASC